MSVSSLLNAVARNVVNPLIVLGFVVAMLYFFWGIFTFIRNAGDEKGRDEGKQSILWGLIGIFVMVSVYGIINVILHTFGIDQTTSVNSNEYLNSLLK